MAAPDRVETARLLLVRPQANDANAIFARYSSDLEVTRYLGWPRHESVAETRAFLQLSEAEWTQSGCGPYLIWSRAGQLLGGTGLSLLNREKAATGYVLAKDAWGLGYATEALSAIVLVAGQICVKHLHAVCHVDHRASAQVLEKCGFKLSHIIQDQSFPNLTPSTSAALYYGRLLVP